jgi:hypothetical protein
LEALRALESYAKEIGRMINEVSRSTGVSLEGGHPQQSRHVSWQQGSPPSSSSDVSLKEVVERLAVLEQVYGQLKAKVESSSATSSPERRSSSEPESIAATPPPSKLSPEDLALLADMNGGGGGTAATGKTPARWRDFVTGAAA